MKFKKYNCKYENKKYIIEQDLPEIGWYVFVFDEKGNCIADYLQDKFETAVEFANEEFNVPMTIWKEIE